MENNKNRKPILFCISGKMGVGKDTIAALVSNKLKETNDIEFTKLTFSDSLREEINELICLLKCSDGFDFHGYVNKNNVKLSNLLMAVDLLFSDEKFSDYDYNTQYRTPNMRKLLQFWGTNVRREQDENYWVNKLAIKITSFLENGKSVYITDSRFSNEIDVIKSLGGKAFRLEASEQTRMERIFKRDSITPTSESLNHPSETALDNYFNYDLIIDTNNKDINDIVDVIISNLNI